MWNLILQKKSSPFRKQNVGISKNNKSVDISNGTILYFRTLLPQPRVLLLQINLNNILIVRRVCRRSMLQVQWQSVL